MSRNAWYVGMWVRLMWGVKSTHLPCTCESKFATCCVCCEHEMCILQRLDEECSWKYLLPIYIAHARRCVKAGKLLIGWLIQKGQSLSRKWYDVTVMSSLDQWEEEIPWKYPCEGIKRGNE